MDPEVIVTNLHRRYTGVSGTINALLPTQSRMVRIGFVGTDLPGAQQAKREHPENFRYLKLWQAVFISRKRLADGTCRIWHVRRDPEMLLAILLRDVLRFPIRIIFTSAAQRRHSWLPRWLIDRMDTVIATTPEAATFVRTSVVIPHGVDSTYFKPPLNKLNAWKTTGIPGKYGIGTFGRIRPEKGTDVFVEAMIRVLPMFPDFTAVIVGLCLPQFEGFKADLESRISKANLTHRILFIGEIPPQKIQDWYANCLITFACPRYEGYGMTVLEGMACGCAVVASDTGIFRKILEGSKTGKVVGVSDMSSITTALIDLMTNPLVTLEIGKSGITFIREHYSSNLEATRICEIYRLELTRSGIL